MKKKKKKSFDNRCTKHSGSSLQVKGINQRYTNTITLELECYTPHHHTFLHLYLRLTVHYDNIYVGVLLHCSAV